MRNLFTVLVFCLLVISAASQTTGSARSSATIIAPDNFCSLALNSADGNMFTLANGQDNCFDITLGAPDPLMPAGNIITRHHQFLDYSVQPPPFSNDIRVTILPSGAAPPLHKNTPFTLSIHYN